MKYWTYQEIKQKIQRDLDLEGEDFIQPEELVEYINEGIDEAEAEIHTLYEDYFLSHMPLTLTEGVEAYDMPTDIYANKIRSIMYANGPIVYEIKLIPSSKRIRLYHELKASGSGSYYQYIIDNSTVGEPKIIICPPPIETGTVGEIWYLRNANRLELDADICDIPEFVKFVIQFAKVRCYEKEGHPNLPLAIQALEQHRANMNATLAAMTASANDNMIEPDLTHYKEHV